MTVANRSGLPDDQLAVLRTLYEWSYVGREQLSHPDYPEHFKVSQRPGKQVQVRVRYSPAPFYLVRAELIDRVADIHGTLKVLLDKRLLISHGTGPTDSGARWKLPDGRIVSTSVEVESKGQGSRGKGHRIVKVFVDGKERIRRRCRRNEPDECYELAPEAISIAEASAGAVGTKPPWEPPPGYVGTKTIMHDPRFKKLGKNPPRSTIQRWGERSEKEGEPVKIERAPDTHECYYPQQWVMDQVERWNPRKRNLPA